MFIMVLSEGKALTVAIPKGHLSNRSVQWSFSVVSSRQKLMTMVTMIENALTPAAGPALRQLLPYRGLVPTELGAPTLHEGLGLGSCHSTVVALSLLPGYPTSVGDNQWCRGWKWWIVPSMVIPLQSG
ncbi:UNVERIFIED_CONTAM: hypothetical protein K2H54_038612 [Gekko kuhli]